MDIDFVKECDRDSLVIGKNVLIFNTWTLLRGCFVFWICNSILPRVHLQVTVLFLLCLIFYLREANFTRTLLTFIRLSLNKWCWSWWLLWWQCLNNWTLSPTFSLLSKRGCVRWCIRLSREVFAPSYFCMQVKHARHFSFVILFSNKTLLSALPTTGWCPPPRKPAPHSHIIWVRFLLIP